MTIKAQVSGEVRTTVLRQARLDSLAKLDADDPVGIQFDILMEALEIYIQRNQNYKDNWHRFGWRGCMFRLRERTERAWDHWWNADKAIGGDQTDVDDLIDLINFAAFTVRAIREGNRDGSWF